VEAERLAEQARRNIELRKQMAEQEEALRQQRMARKTINQEDLAQLIDQHMRWQDVYGIDEATEFDKIPDDAQKDPRRLSLTAADISGVEFDRTVTLIGAMFKDCEFTDCKVSVELIASSVASCTFLNCVFEDIYLRKCQVSRVAIERLNVENVRLEDTTVMRAKMRGTTIRELFSSSANSFIKCDFADAIFKGCDMKKNAFMSCDFTNASLIGCDFRDSVFQICQTDDLHREGSLFRGVKVSR
jgi:uncharacterized protein YjbI with pentapeptide repeats